MTEAYPCPVEGCGRTRVSGRLTCKACFDLMTLEERATLLRDLCFVGEAAINGDQLRMERSLAIAEVDLRHILYRLAHATGAQQSTSS